MKTRTILAFARYLEKVPRERFDQRYFVYPASCGSTACVAGHFCLWRGLVPQLSPAAHMDGLFLDDDVPVRPWGYASAGMGLDSQQAAQMFWSGARHRTPRAAAKALRRLVEKSRRNKC